MMILEKPGSGDSGCGVQVSQVAASGEGELQEHHSAAEVTKLKEMLTQRDKEMSILWHNTVQHSLVPVQLYAYGKTRWHSEQLS